jgi:hypothetical protein
VDDVEQSHDFADPSADHAQRGSGVYRRTSAFELEEGERDGGEHDVVRPARVRAPFEVIKAEVVFALAILLLDRPSAAGQRDEVHQRRRRRQVQQVVLPLVGRRSFAEQPAVPAPLRRPHAQRTEPRG